MKNAAFLDTRRGLFTVTLGEEETARLKRLAGQARHFFWNLDPTDWNSAQDAGFLRDIKAGALVLDALAHHPAENKLLRLEDARLAYFALHGFAAGAMVIPLAERQAASDMILLLANCRAISLELDVLPSEPDVPLALAVDETVSKHLVAMLKAKACGDSHYQLGVGDGLALYRALALERCVDLQCLTAALEKSTHNIRVALSDLTDDS